MDLTELVRSLLTISPNELVDDPSAARAIVDIRWPQGARCMACGSAANLQANTIVCDAVSCRAQFSIFIGTPLASLRRPRPRALLLALRAMATDARGISARALARSVGVPHVTIWRHIHRLRRLLPGAPPPIVPAASVQVCGRHGGGPRAGTVVVGRGIDRYSFTVGEATKSKPELRIIGETIRTWLNGTFHGVTSRYLAWYLHEATARASYSPADCLAQSLARLLAPATRWA